MPDSDIDLLQVDRGTVTAPAGCGKTHLIAQALSRHQGTKPLLVLTHTNAGVAALRTRLDNAWVSPRAYRLSTIDGWAMRLISAFPQRSAHVPEILKLGNPSTNYPDIRAAAAILLKAGHISDALVASYDRLIVDEYQDCSVRQHAIVAHAANSLPTCVLGDPLQAIFGFSAEDPLANWDEQVCRVFPVVGELEKPWRWINSGAESLGHWLLNVRSDFMAGRSVDLRGAPTSVTWVELNGTDDRKRCLIAARTRPKAGGRVLIIGDSVSPDSQQKYACQTPGAVTVEAVDLKDLVAFGHQLNLGAAKALEQTVNFAQKVMTNVEAATLMKRLDTLVRGRGRAAPSRVEASALTFTRNPSHRGVADLLGELAKKEGVRTYRPALLRACHRALELAAGTDELSFADATIRVREQNRLVGRTLPRRGVGSTLLLKGLEAEVAVILNPAGMDPNNLYVAMTRGSTSLVICAPTHLLAPR